MVEDSAERGHHELEERQHHFFRQELRHQIQKDEEDLAHLTGHLITQRQMYQELMDTLQHVPTNCRGSYLVMVKGHHEYCATLRKMATQVTQ